MAPISKATDKVLVTLMEELVGLDIRRETLQATIRAYTGKPENPKHSRKAAPISVKAPRRRMRKAKRGERQSIILDAYKSLEEPTDIKAFARGLGGSAKQRRLWAASIHRQGYTGRMDIRDGVIYPVEAR